MSHFSSSSSPCPLIGIGSYSTWDEPTRIKWLMEELDGKRPLIRTSDIGECRLYGTYSTSILMQHPFTFNGHALMSCSTQLPIPYYVTIKKEKILLLKIL
jgi:hypothetical protein